MLAPSSVSRSASETGATRSPASKCQAAAASSPSPSSSAALEKLNFTSERCTVHLAADES